MGSALIADLLLWLIGFSIVSMVGSRKNDAIENVERHIGKVCAYLIALVSVTIFPVWYALQTKLTAYAIDLSLYGSSHSNTKTHIIYGVTLGIIIAFVALNKIMIKIRWLNTVALPLLIGYYLFEILSSDNKLSIPWKFEISATCVAEYMAFFFSGMINLPTFFRHARSKYDSYLALTLITIILYLFQMSSMFLPVGISNGNLFHLLSSSGIQITVQKFLLVNFCVFMLFCSNLVNIYFAKPSLEFLFPKTRKSLLCLGVGLMGTVIYALTEIFFNKGLFIEHYDDVVDNFIANLGTALLVVFLIRIIVKHRPTPFEKVTSIGAWVIGCITTTVAAVQQLGTPPLFAGVGATILCYIVVFFIEEPFWSAIKLKRLKKRQVG